MNVVTVLMTAKRPFFWWVWFIEIRQPGCTTPPRSHKLILKEYFERLPHLISRKILFFSFQSNTNKSFQTMFSLQTIFLLLFLHLRLLQEWHFFSSRSITVTKNSVVFDRNRFFLLTRFEGMLTKVWECWRRSEKNFIVVPSWRS